MNVDVKTTIKKIALAFALLAAVTAAAVAFRYAIGRSDSTEPDGGVATKVGGQNFIRWNTPRALPVIAFIDENGGTAALQEFHGRVVLLNIWATWCLPCRQEMPALDRLQAKLGGPDFEVVALSIDSDGVDAVRRFYRDIGIKHLRIYNDPAADATTRLHIVGVPATLLIDPGGREVGRALGPAAWDAPEAIEFIRARLNQSSK